MKKDKQFFDFKSISRRDWGVWVEKSPSGEYSPGDNAFFIGGLMRIADSLERIEKQLPSLNMENRLKKIRRRLCRLEQKKRDNK